MAEEKAGLKGTVAGWVKAGVTSVLGLASGAVLMYLTPLVNNAIKPARPVANFAIQAQGLTVTFDNRSTGGAQGWWDFGDGSALEPFAADADTISHAYPRPGNYSVKLTLANLIGEENERVISVAVDPKSAPQPEIELFQVVPVAGGAAPAAFQVKTKVKNAQLLIWSMGDDRPVDLSEGSTPDQERTITLKTPGAHTLRLVAINGEQKVEKAERVVVRAQDQAAPTATLGVAYDAAKVDRKGEKYNVPVSWSAGPKDGVSPFAVSWAVEKGFQIGSAALANPADKGARNVKVEVSPDRTRFVVKGELVRPTGPLAPSAPPRWLATVAVQLERKSAPVTKTMEDIRVGIRVPGRTEIPIPALSGGWQATQKRLNLKLEDGTRLAWGTPGLPNNATVHLKNRPMRVTAAEQGGRLILDVAELHTALQPVGN